MDRRPPASFIILSNIQSVVEANLQWPLSQKQVLSAAKDQNYRWTERLKEVLNQPNSTPQCDFDKELKSDILEVNEQEDTATIISLKK